MFIPHATAILRQICLAICSVEKYDYWDPFTFNNKALHLFWHHFWTTVRLQRSTSLSSIHKLQHLEPKTTWKKALKIWCLLHQQREFDLQQTTCLLDVTSVRAKENHFHDKFPPRRVKNVILTAIQWITKHGPRLKESWNDGEKRTNSAQRLNPLNTELSPICQ